MSKRKVFFTDPNTCTNPICACGALFVNTQSKKVLLIEYIDSKNKQLDDLGGKVDHIDYDKYDTIWREVQEESNNLINKNTILDIQAKGNNIYECYCSYSKYFFIIVEVDDLFFPDTNVFGTLETCENINRTIKWYDIKYVLINRLLPHRVVTKNIIAYLKQLSK